MRKTDSAPPRHRSRARRRVSLRLVAQAILTGGLIALSLLIAWPFMHAITWGVALAIMAWPVHKRVKARLAGPSLAASASTMIVLLLIVLPGIFVVYQVGRETEEIAKRLKTPPEEVVTREKLQEVPGGSRVVAWMERLNVDVEKELKAATSSVLPDIEGVAQVSLTAAAQFLVAMFILFYVFRDRGEFIQWLRAFLPWTRAEGDHIFASAADSVYANLYATVVTGLIDSITGALLFWIVGVPAPFLWGSVMFILSLLPVVGAGLIWVPVAIYLATTGSWPAAAAILTWGAITMFVVDYILYAKLAGDRMRMHPVPALIAFIGGLGVFGLSGMILGPAIVAMTAAVLDVWRTRSAAAATVDAG